MGFFKKLGKAVGKVFNKVVKPIAKNIPVVGTVVQWGDTVLGSKGLGKYIEKGINSIVDKKSSTPANETDVMNRIDYGIDAYNDGKLRSYGIDYGGTYSSMYGSPVLQDGQTVTSGIASTYSNNILDLANRELNTKRMFALQEIFSRMNVNLDDLATELKFRGLL